MKYVTIIHSRYDKIKTQSNEKNDHINRFIQ